MNRINVAQALLYIAALVAATVVVASLLNQVWLGAAAGIALLLLSVFAIGSLKKRNR
jgi:4-hydroxybenzoate polyprenyltransferase